MKHRIELKKDGEVTYETIVKIRSLNDGLKDLRHSIHTNYSFCWNKKSVDSKPIIDIINRSNKHICIDNTTITQGVSKYTWNFIINPPLRKEESCEFGWRTIFSEYFPSTRESLKNALQQPDYPFPNNTIEHHYYINHPTQELEIELDFEDGSGIDNFEALVFNGRCFSRECIDNSELLRIKNNLKVKSYLTKKIVTLAVTEPLFGRNYAISWSLVN